MGSFRSKLMLLEAMGAMLALDPVERMSGPPLDFSKVPPEPVRLRTDTDREALDNAEAKRRRKAERRRREACKNRPV